jgi:multicomponent Na+:H+ antiporter subunit D
VLTGAGRAPHVAHVGWSGAGLILGCLSTVAAIGIALAGVFRRQLPRALTDPARRALTGLHKLHSGHVGDYVAWLVLGVGVLTGIVLATA